MLMPTPDFDLTFREGALCSFCGSPRSKGDDFVLRGPEVEFEGSIGMCGNCAREAGACFGMVTPATYEDAIEQCKSAESRCANLALEIAELTERTRTLTLQNAEMISEMAYVYEGEDEEAEDEWLQD